MSDILRSRPTLADIRKAATQIAPLIHHTPVLTCASLDQMAGATLFFKCENLQKVGAFKFRGACHAVFSLSEEDARRGVATHSSGNHAAALALAARLRGIAAHVVMPSNAPQIKQAAVAGYGANITCCAPTQEAREATLAEVCRQTGAVEIHPYDNFQIITGQGTAALELLEEVEALDLVLVPVGGGGLLSGTAIATTSLSPKTHVIAVEPAGADDAYRSWKSGSFVPSVSPQTIADGLRSSLGRLPFAIIQDTVHDVITVSEDAIIAAMRAIWERMKVIIEPSSALPVAALLQGQIPPQYRRIGVIFSGGNVDLSALPW